MIIEQKLAEQGLSEIRFRGPDGPVCIVKTVGKRPDIGARTVRVLSVSDGSSTEPWAFNRDGTVDLLERQIVQGEQLPAIIERFCTPSV